MKIIQMLTGCCIVILLVGLFNVNTKAAPEQEENGSAPLLKKIATHMSAYVEGLSDTEQLSLQVKQLVLGEIETGKTINARHFFGDSKEDKAAFVYAVINKSIQNQTLELMNDGKATALSGSILSISDAMPDAVIGGNGRYLKSMELLGAYFIETLDPGAGDRLFEKYSLPAEEINTGLTLSADQNNEKKSIPAELSIF